MIESTKSARDPWGRWITATTSASARSAGTWHVEWGPLPTYADIVLRFFLWEFLRGPLTNVNIGQLRERYSRTNFSRKAPSVFLEALFLPVPPHCALKGPPRL